MEINVKCFGLRDTDFFDWSGKFIHSFVQLLLEGKWKHICSCIYDIVRRQEVWVRMCTTQQDSNAIIWLRKKTSILHRVKEVGKILRRGHVVPSARKIMQGELKTNINMILLIWTKHETQYSKSLYNLIQALP